MKQLLVSSDQEKKEQAFKIFMDKMATSEKSVQERGYYSEKEVEEELEKIRRKNYKDAEECFRVKSDGTVVCAGAFGNNDTFSINDWNDIELP